MSIRGLLEPVAGVDGRAVSNMTWARLGLRITVGRCLTSPTQTRRWRTW